MNKEKQTLETKQKQDENELEYIRENEDNDDFLDDTYGGILDQAFNRWEDTIGMFFKSKW